MMAVLSSNHADIEEFIKSKQTSGVLTKFNLFVAIDDKFMHAVEEDDFYELGFKNKITKKVKARSCRATWKNWPKTGGWAGTASPSTAT